MSWNGSGSNAPAAQPAQKPTAAKKSPSVVKGIVAGVVVVVLSVVAYFAFFSCGEKPVKVIAKEKTTKIKEAKPAVAKPQVEKPQKAEGAVKSEAPDMWLGSKVVGFSAKTNAATGKVIQTIRTQDGKVHKRLIEPDNSIFDNVADQMIAMSVSTPPGEVMPPLPLYPGFEKDFVAALDKPIEIKEDDSPEVKALKERVAEVRAQMKDLIANGTSVREILTEHQALWNENVEIRRKAQKELKEIVDSGNEEDARKYRNTINAALQQMGIEGINMPGTTGNLKKKEALKLRKGMQ